MGLFGNPKTPAGGNSAAGFEFGERKEMTGPLPIVDNLMETAQWLENARNQVVQGGASCCLVVCAPNPIEGAAMPNQSVDISVSVSLGGVMMDSSPVQELINRADKAMEAGRISGNYTCMWTSDLH